MTEVSGTGTRARPAGGGDGGAILEARAAALARPLVEEDVDTVALVTFLAGRRSYAVAARSVERVLAGAGVSRLPWAPPAMVGVANAAGDILPVVDVERLIGVGACRPGGPILVVEHDGGRLGLLTEAVSDLVAVPRQALVAPAGELTATAGLVIAVTGATLVIDVAALLTATPLTLDRRKTDDASAR